MWIFNNSCHFNEENSKTKANGGFSNPHFKKNPQSLDILCTLKNGYFIIGEKKNKNADKIEIIFKD